MTATNVATNIRQAIEYTWLVQDTAMKALEKVATLQAGFLNDADNEADEKTAEYARMVARKLDIVLRDYEILIGQREG
jgi:predicted kinase